MKESNKPGRPANLNSMGIHRTLAILYAGLGVVFFFVLFPSESDHGAAYGISGLLLAVGAFHAVVAFGASRSAGWARVLSIIVGILLLFGFPLGTLVGGYLLFNSKWPERVNA